MTVSDSGTNWKAEMGLQGRKPPRFFESPTDIDAGGIVPQAHALRRAFDDLDLDGIFCLDNTPLLYFKEVPRIDPAEVWELHRTFWNQGLAPVLVLITPGDVHIYSGLAKPPGVGENVESGDRFVDKLNRIKEAAEVRQLVVSVESGEFFRLHAKSFDRERRVDRELLKNLEATRERLDEVSDGEETTSVLDALLCRVVFTNYLFDREVIEPAYLEEAGIADAKNLRDIVNRTDREEARTLLYRLFEQLGWHFNGDLFSDDLDIERSRINDAHIEILDRFLRGADVRTGQGSFWPYDFSVIPIETISAIYEHFLKAKDPKEKKATGAFYTPRFLAEIVLDMALEGLGTLLNKRFLDPACGSGIFLVGLFNRLAEEWSRTHPNAPYDERANGLMTILRENIFGVDRKDTACRIAAFSLYLAMLDQLRPSDIRELYGKGKVLPPLVYDPEKPSATREGKTIIRADFFAEEAGVPLEAFDVVVGNPPWAKLKGPKVQAEVWCDEHGLSIPYRQLAQAFVWKAPLHLKPKSRVCFVLPHSVLFNQQAKAVTAQREWLKRHSVDSILNLADFQRFLFDAEQPAVVVRYTKEAPADRNQRIEYLAPKTDWSVSQAAVISVVPEDRTEFRLRDVLSSLRDLQRPIIWKERFWGTPRDSKFLDRLASLPRLQEIVGRAKDKQPKRWFMSQGIQPVGPGDDPSKARQLELPSKLFLKARGTRLELFVFEEDCEELPSPHTTIRDGSNTNTTPFLSPHVLVSQGMRVAYADFAVSFQDAIQGLHGPEADKPLLMFLTAYLRSPLARYFLFHVTENWGIERATVHLNQLLTIPFLFPEQSTRPERAAAIVEAISRTVSEATNQARGDFADREQIVRQAQSRADELIYEYFDVDEVERTLVEDTLSIIIPSTRPSRASNDIPTLVQSSPNRRERYKETLCRTLNGWAEGGPYRVKGTVRFSDESGVGVVILERLRTDAAENVEEPHSEDLIPLLSHLQEAFKRQLGSIEMVRGLKVFDPTRLYIVKPLNQRFWTDTAALNDADEVAATILMQPAVEAH
ncbi:MAG: N-6 DNA methylase [Acidimicrobiales bacterium]